MGREKTPISPDATGPKRKIPIPPSRDRRWWKAIARDAVRQYVDAQLAVVWPEVEFVLGETPWLHNEFSDSFGPRWHVDPHHLKAARLALTPSALVPDASLLNLREVVAWISNAAIRGRGQATEVRDLAASKRRLYRHFLTWTGNHRLCGDVAETLVENTLLQLRGTRVWLAPGSRRGRVSALQGRALEVGGPLDAAGEWPVDPARLAAGATPFAVEVKNVRATLYPYDHDVWDLLAKLGAFPDVVPILVARRVHLTTFRMFSDLGALGVTTNRQWFSPAIPEDEFRRTVGPMRLGDARQVALDATPSGLLKFFSVTGPEHAAASLARWQRAAPIVDRYRELRDPDLDGATRKTLWHAFAGDIVAAGLYERGGWAPRAVVEEDVDVEARVGETYDEDDWRNAEQLQAEREEYEAAMRDAADQYGGE